MAAKPLETAFLIRRTEEALLRLFSEGQLHGTVHTCLGQEFTGACLAPLLEKKDSVFSTHRGHGHYLSLTGDLDGFLRELLGREGGCVGGVGGSQHLHKGNYFSNGIQGGILPLAAGAALAHQLDKNKAVSVAITGDGTLGEGALYETLNIASAWRLPFLLVLEDNQYAQSTKTSDVMTGSAKARLLACGLKVFEGDTWSWKKLGKVFENALRGVRAGKGPAAVIVRTYRLAPHSTRDDFRAEKELAAARKKDPLNLLLAKKDKAALAADALASARLERALSAALSAPAVKPPALENAPVREWEELASRPAGKDPYRVHLNKAYSEILAKDKNALMIGEDLEDPYGGCFKVTEGMSRKFTARVRNTTISEAAIAGIATGAALMGKRSFAEFMFGDFTLLAMDQIVNHAAKFAEMYPARKARVVFRTPMGGGRGYGPTHSQSLEKHFLGVPGLDVYSLNAFVDPREFFRAVKLEGPALIAEHKLLYREPLITEWPAPWKVWREKASGDTLLLPGEMKPKVLLAAYGHQGAAVWEAAKRLLAEQEVPVAVLVPCRLSDFDARSHEEIYYAPQAVAFEEGNGYASFSSELAAQLQPRSVLRWSPPNRAIPSAPSLEAEFRLTPEKVIAEVLETLS
jgi:2-oxoisovalerate dehydrogenase E1 component